MKIERLSNMENYIGTQKIVSIQELCSRYNVSINTVRRDLDLLQNQGKITKIYGGAKSSIVPSINTDILKSFGERTIENSVAKNMVAKVAAGFVKENDTIFIDTGTSTVLLLQYLTRLSHLTIVTNSVYILFNCLEFPQFTTICLPGIVKNKTASIVGEQCLAAIGSYNINKAFMACVGLSLENGATNSSVDDSSIKRSILKHSKYHYLLTDNSKFDKSSLMTFANLTDFNYIITDTKPKDDYVDFFSENNIKLILSNKT